MIFLDKTCDKENSYISGNVKSQIKKIDQEGCKKACLTDPRDNCKYAKYDKKLERCFLSEMSYGDAKKQNLIRSSDNFHLYYAC